MTTVLEPLTGGGRTVLTGTLGEPGLDDAGYTESEWICRGSAVSYSAPDGLPGDGHWSLEVASTAPFATRVVVRRPVDPDACSNTVVIEWLNVSSGSDAAPLYGFLAPELLRRGHVWVGVSAQWSGIVAAPPLVTVGDGVAGGLSLVGLADADPERYGILSHPGDAFAFDIFTRAATAVTAPDGPLSDVEIRKLLAIGESQSGYALTTYLNGVQPLTDRFDGFLIHSRGGPAMPLGEAGCGVDMEAGRADPPVRLRTDLDAPVIVVETETDLLGYLRFLPARQDDTDRLRLWEVAGAAHADRSIIGEFEELLGCSDPVNRGQQRFVVRSALRHLVDWAGTGTAPPSASPLAVAVDESGSTVRRRFETDELGNVLGGVRTPCVDAAVETLSGLCRDGESHVCQLFGRRLALPDAVLMARYPTLASYREAYAAATDRAIDDGFILADDRDEVLDDAPADVITW